jgi:uncharacterized protein YbbC (DUF1343 family)
VANYSHKDKYVLPVNPSPNLNTPQAILLYPGLCLFEGTVISVGRGTLAPFTRLGHPLLKGKYDFSFTPVDIAGMSENPPEKGQVCYGLDLAQYDTDAKTVKNKLNLSFLIAMYNAFPDKAHFFNAYFTKLAGTDVVRKQIETVQTEQQIRASWEPALSRYKIMRRKYLLYN